MIDWNLAPDWARYAAMDKDKTWYWYEERPYSSSIGIWFPIYRIGEKPKFKSFYALPILISWDKTLQEKSNATIN